MNDEQTAALAKLAARLPGIPLTADDLDLYRTDIFYESALPPLAVASPRHSDDVRALVVAARDLGLSLAPRGGGLSYSAGYLAANSHTVLVDLSGMNRLIEVNVEDRYVTVEPGVTWAQLREALRATGLTTPFWGTFSGRHATIGASLSQGAKFYGSASRGTSAESVLALEVVTGTGDVVTTGSAAGVSSPSPFFRNYGPDLTGLFLGDCGAFGIKVKATLQLIPAPGAIAVCSYSFDDPVSQLEAMAEIGAQMLATECSGIDPYTARSRVAGDGLASDLKALGQLVAGSRSLVSGMADAAQVAFSGRRFIERIGYLMNCVVEGCDARDARSRLWRVRTIARDRGGRPVPATIPRMMRALPFPPMNGLLTPSGKRMNWLHTVVPNSRGGDCFRRTEAVFHRNAETMKRHGIDRGYLLSTHGPSGVGIETLIRWSDRAYPIHTHFLTGSERKNIRLRDDNPAALEAVTGLSREIVAEWRDLGGVHLQIGRKYPYFETRLPATARFLIDLKRTLDPDGIFNPGSVISTQGE